MASLPSSIPLSEEIVSPTPREASGSLRAANVVAGPQPTPEPRGTSISEADVASGAKAAHHETDEEAIARLAALNPVEYGRVRKEEAKALGISIKILDEQVKTYATRTARAVQACGRKSSRIPTRSTRRKSSTRWRESSAASW